MSRSPGFATRAVSQSSNPHHIGQRPKLCRDPAAIVARSKRTYHPKSASRSPHSVQRNSRAQWGGHPETSRVERSGRALWGKADLGAGLSGVFSPSAAVTFRLLRLLLYLIREPAEFIGNVWCLQGQIAQTVGRIAEERRFSHA
jgi:hypothetical protein